MQTVNVRSHACGLRRAGVAPAPYVLTPQRSRGTPRNSRLEKVPAHTRCRAAHKLPAGWRRRIGQPMARPATAFRVRRAPASIRPEAAALPANAGAAATLASPMRQTPSARTPGTGVGIPNGRAVLALIRELYRPYAAPAIRFPSSVPRGAGP